MSLALESVFSESFRSYGQVVSGYDFVPLLAALREKTPLPETGVVYLPSEPALEELPVYGELANRYYGGMPIQLGYCNGVNDTLGCLEYHRDSEVDIAADDCILLLARQEEIAEGKLDTAKVRAFLLPAGTGVELYATTLHYAPCGRTPESGFRVVIVLPRGTNTGKPAIQEGNLEDRWLFACNKWLLAHAEAPEAGQGAYVGLTGENLHITGEEK
ncbi:MAG: DUF4867 family protein [Provencibacterium sp.]|jgi:hypothetical protein|nr:DUF4867 family protein [Provencibacterium sp.]